MRNSAFRQPQRPLLLAGLLLFLGAPTAAENVSEPFELSKRHGPGEVVQGVRLLGALKLDHTQVDGYDLRELSGLAWDADAGVLIMLSDDGYLAHTRPVFENGVLVRLQYLAAFPLRDAGGRPVEGDAADSEGLAIRNARNGEAGDTELLVSFEVEPRLLRYTSEGRRLGAIELPPALAAIDNYQGENKALEAITEHPAHGVLLAPERPLAGDPGPGLPLFTLAGERWRYPPVDPDYSSIVELETAHDGRLLVLERRFKNIFSPVVFSIRALSLPAPDDPLATPAVTDIVRLSNKSEIRVDNFEGLARHEGRRYFVVSDDNESSIQKTLLLYLEILGEDA